MGALRAKFGEICQALGVGFVELSDVKKVDPRALFRAKILDNEKRRELLMVAKKLNLWKGMKVFICRKIGHIDRDRSCLLGVSKLKQGRMVVRFV